MATSAFMFGPWACRWSEVFYLSKLSIALVNHKPIVPGHCLVLSKRIVPRFGELSPEEVADLWQTAQKISGPLQNHFNADALTFAIQDGASAGQSVPHVHVHVVPRAKGDFTKNDEVYDRLEKADMARSFKVDAEKERKVRTMDEMAMEASQLRALFPSSMDIPSDDYPLA